MTDPQIEMEVLLDVLRKQFILHIPHSSTVIPDKQGFNANLIDSEIELLTDHATDKIFDMDGVDKIIFPWSRIFCDVERLVDEEEPMYEFGRGFYYTKTDYGENLREINPIHKQKVKEEYYDKHHNYFTELVKDKLKDYGHVYIIDCHSFTDTPFNSDIDKNNNRPDICLGVDKIHTPDWMISQFKNYFEYVGFTVGINTPYSGTIIPLEYYGNKNVSSIMIEINRKLYMNIDGLQKSKVDYLKNILNDLIPVK